MKEHWKAVVGLPEYQVSTLGQVRSLKRGRLMTIINNNGYAAFRPMSDREQVTRPVAQAVLEAFIGLPEPDQMRRVKHLDGDGMNACLDNIKWYTRQEYAAVHNLVALRGEDNPKHKLTSEEVRRIKSYISQGRTLTSLAKDFGVSLSMVSRIKSGTRRATEPK
ncbi:hypothetical protein Dxin01_00152 [Deinococcus xinjiangensis]|uniref:NUMOD4 domain-containing protein n=1 Tax=Deinococcus xinjiangensis TaxID=457454 RepID=A0ABP9V599_9DEIO